MNPNECWLGQVGFACSSSVKQSTCEWQLSNRVHSPKIKRLSVIFAKFDYRIAVETFGIGKTSTSSQVFELYGYGTAVRFPFEEDSI